MKGEPIPQVLLDYIEGLKTHDVARVAGTVAQDLLFIAATRILDKPQFLRMLTALYAGFPDWTYDYDEIEDRGQGNYAIKWRQGGTHRGTWAMPGMDPIPATGRTVRIPPHYFFYRIAGERLTIIFPEPVPGGAPRGILEQIGVALPPL
ncbi:MAG TPA: nuclear transport factor 2 family protein [Burkholderiales bacterium]|nr:nuclear transport factor 2 family protein [Burkholderiales bacterium]